MASKVFLHVGAPLAPAAVPRSGLARHRRRLARTGVLYPPDHLGHDGGHPDAVLDALSLSADDRAAPGAWDRLAENVRDWRRGTALVSHELLADATPAQVDRVVSSLGESEVHVVYVARDLGRQVPRAWQQWVHNGGTVPFATYAARILKREQHRSARVFWRSHDLGDVLTRWASRIPVERVHVVTAAKGPQSAEETWRRFAGVVGIDASRHPLGRVPPDALAPLPGTEVVRLLNAADALGGACAPERLSTVAERTLAVGGPAPRLPEALQQDAETESERMLSTVRSRGWRLVGSADDLVSDADAFTTDPAEVEPSHEDVIRAHTEMLLHLCTEERQGPAGIHRRALRVLLRDVRPLPSPR